MDPSGEFARVLGDSLRFTYDSDGSASVRAGYTTGWRIMPTAVVALLVKGRAIIEIEDARPLSYDGGTAICIPAGVNHRASHPVDGVAATSHVAFHVFTTLDVLSLIEVPQCLFGAAARRIGEINLELSALAKSPRGLLSDACARQALGLSLLRVLIDESTVTARAMQAMRSAQRLGLVLAGVDRDLGGVDVAEMARLAGLSRSRLHEVFMSAFTCSPMQYVRSRRLQRARECLATTDLQILEVAELAGFDDQFHFSRVFKRAHGTSPTDYRRQIAQARF